MADNEAMSVEDIQNSWGSLPDGLKSHTMKTLYDVQTRTVIDLQRAMTEKGGEIAMAMAKAMASNELHNEELLKQVIEGEVMPLRKEYDDMGKQLAFERELLDEYLRLGKGYI